MADHPTKYVVAVFYGQYGQDYSDQDACSLAAIIFDDKSEAENYALCLREEGKTAAQHGTVDALVLPVIEERGLTAMELMRRFLPEYAHSDEPDV